MKERRNGNETSIQIVKGHHTEGQAAVISAWKFSSKFLFEYSLMANCNN